MCQKLICLFSPVFVLLAIAPAANAQVTNLLRNPSFEEDELILDDPDWSTWTTWNPAEGAGSNAVIVDTEASGFVENEWIGRGLVLGDTLRAQVTMPDPRCVMTTLAQDEAARR